MNDTAQPNHDEQFHADLEALRAKYPMCYIEAWNPDDFAVDEDGNQPDEPVDWNDPRWEGVADRLADNFDANHGTNWSRLREAVADELPDRTTGWQQRLAAGDEVTWNDPDAGLCSRTGIIASILHHEQTVTITWTDGNILDCFYSELS